ncbi:hypothetical protein GCM10025867_23340 [Frondihabitans sucicola]|uniref:DUF1697 domain-containing protein n=1 Tax=Frondihabitans sucicola TaxID=1268041 RepID=A0ABN6Y302_9MICO|nr:DUF1697 domain-containing protein [Frondihabitans sucicola]BDZ50093.1 hypothetical protein GCM10025867_23340 [Frondihabitans sucicola]
MGDWVALLRGINVGPAKRIAMADLRAVFDRLGFTDVATLLNSGNVVFAAGADAQPDAATIRRAVHGATGVDSEVVLLDAATFRSVADANPLRGEGREPKRIGVAFAGEDLDPALVAVPDADLLGEEELEVVPRAVYQWLPNGVLASPVPASFWKTLGTPVTARNDATVQKIVALLERRAD